LIRPHQALTSALALLPLLFRLILTAARAEKLTEIAHFIFDSIFIISYAFILKRSFFQRPAWTGKSSKSATLRG
jgi:hypothetical protein